MDRIYRGFETALLGLALCLGFAVCLSIGTPPETAGPASVTLPMLSVTLAAR